MPSQEPTQLFVYGTLTDPERVISLTGKRFARDRCNAQWI